MTSRSPERRVVRLLHVHPWGRISRSRELGPVTDTVMVATDIIGFASRYRDAGAQLYARQVLYALLIKAFTITGLPWWECYHEDRGDGALIVGPPDVDADQFLDPLTHHLNALLRSHARGERELLPLQLRMAVHYGRVYHDAHGVTGHALTHLFRLLEAPAFKKAVATAGVPLGAIVSDRLYTDVVQRGGLINPAAYSQLRLTCKETRTRAWLRLPGGPA